MQQGLSQHHVALSLHVVWQPDVAGLAISFVLFDDMICIRVTSDQMITYRHIIRNSSRWYFLEREFNLGHPPGLR